MVAQVARDDIVGVTELEGLLQPITHHGTVRIVRAITSTQPHGILVPHGRIDVDLRWNRACVLHEHRWFDPPILTDREAIAAHRIVVVLHTAEGLAALIQEIHFVPKQLRSGSAEPEAFAVEVEAELRIGEQLTSELVIHHRIVRIVELDLRAIDQELQQTGRDGEGQFHGLGQSQVIRIGELDPGTACRANDIGEEIAAHSHLLADRCDPTEGERTRRILDAHPLVTVPTAYLEEGSATGNGGVEDVIVELVLRELRQLLATGVQHQRDQAEEEWMAHGVWFNG